MEFTAASVRYIEVKSLKAGFLLLISRGVISLYSSLTTGLTRDHGKQGGGGVTCVKNDLTGLHTCMTSGQILPDDIFSNYDKS